MKQPKVQFTNTKATCAEIKEGVRMTGQGIAKTVKNTVRLPKSIHKDYKDRSDMIWQAYQEYRAKQEPASEETVEEGA